MAAFAVGSGIALARGEAGVLETVNQTGSVFHGSVPAVFLPGVLAPRVGGRGALAGFVRGLSVNLALAAVAGHPVAVVEPAGLLLRVRRGAGVVGRRHPTAASAVAATPGPVVLERVPRDAGCPAGPAGRTARQPARRPLTPAGHHAGSAMPQRTEAR
jgi:hypothetical protein